MKIVILLLTFSFATTQSSAQSFSNWMADNARPELQVRWGTKKDANNYAYLVVQIKSSKGCKLNFTASQCNADNKDINGWRNATLLPNKTLQFSFKIMNSCSNGFWWWYRNYQSTAVRID